MPETTPDRRTELLAAAIRLFSDRGYEATSVREIADALAIQAGSLYAHIETKEDLLWQILTESADRFFAAIQPIVDSKLLTLERIRLAIAAHVKVITDSTAAAAVYLREWRHLSEPRKSEFAGRRDAYERIFRDLIRDAIHEGTFGDFDEKFATLMVLSSVNWIYQWYRPDGPMTPDEIARRITDLLFHGLKRAGS